MVQVYPSPLLGHGPSADVVLPVHHDILFQSFGCHAADHPSVVLILAAGLRSC